MEHTHTKHFVSSLSIKSLQEYGGKMIKYPKQKMYSSQLSEIFQWRVLHKFILQKQISVSQPEYQEFDKLCLYHNGFTGRGKALRKSSTQNSVWPCCICSAPHLSLTLSSP